MIQSIKRQGYVYVAISMVATLFIPTPVAGASLISVTALMAAVGCAWTIRRIEYSWLLRVRESLQ